MQNPAEILYHPCGRPDQHQLGRVPALKAGQQTRPATPDGKQLLLATEFVRCPGIPVAAGMSQARITNSVCYTYTAAGVQVVMIERSTGSIPAPPPAPGAPT
ncbi:hypothetical protein FHS42_006048 [Streptomyces zagrosensis]|uniref:Uncharacterized protein n=1 Tax=Streptomyces zagrosensis TaxID=1042984 RepID=A0A7W9V254_9ACTN|nr:hypothetical protein [Streptomyces zagrosensis]